MKIALVAPCPSPYMVGGAQRLWWGWADYMNDCTEHLLELIQLPSPEHDFFSTVFSYERFYRLNLDHFDRVISTKYPAWMVRHRDHRLYLQHTLRGLYDTYTGPMSIDLNACTTRVRELVDLTRRHGSQAISASELERIFQLTHEIHATGSGDEKKSVEFPGYVARSVVQCMDRFAMANDRIKSFCTLSTTVRNRENYFPSDVDVTVIHHPSNLTPAASDQMNHFFASGRFDDPKRMDLIITSYLAADTRIPLKIAGTGPTLEACKKMALNDDRIEFLGYVSGEPLEQLYSQAVAIIFTPEAEDYGLITLEAFSAGRPVITTTDSGGPCELVRDGVNGWVTAPNAAAIAKAIDAAASAVSLCRAMGERGRETVKEITWQRIAEWSATA
jgi:glycosyltransferase involved in cell wall biosynthesis